MAFQIPTTEPDDLVAGDTWQWTRSLADYKASDSWVLTYYLKDATGSPITITASASGDDHLVSVAAATTGAYAAGLYYWTARVSKAGEVHTVDSGRITVVADLSAVADSHDPRHHVEKVLVAIEATIEGRATRQHSTLVVDGLQVGLATPEELYALRDKYRSELSLIEADERVRRGKGNSAKIRARFKSFRAS